MGDLVTATVRHICTRWKCKVTDMVNQKLCNGNVLSKMKIIIIKNNSHENAVTFSRCFGVPIIRNSVSFPSCCNLFSVIQ